MICWSDCRIPSRYANESNTDEINYMKQTDGGAFEKQLDPGRLRLTEILETDVLLQEQGQQTVAIYPS